MGLRRDGPVGRAGGQRRRGGEPREQRGGPDVVRRVSVDDGLVVLPVGEELRQLRDDEPRERDGERGEEGAEQVRGVGGGGGREQRDEAREQPPPDGEAEREVHAQARGHGDEVRALARDGVAREDGLREEGEGEAEDEDGDEQVAAEERRVGPALGLEPAGVVLVGVPGCVDCVHGSAEGDGGGGGAPSASDGAAGPGMAAAPSAAGAAAGRRPSRRSISSWTPGISASERRGSAMSRMSPERRGRRGRRLRAGCAGAFRAWPSGADPRAPSRAGRRGPSRR